MAAMFMNFVNVLALYSTSLYIVFWTCLHLNVLDNLSIWMPIQYFAFNLYKYNLVLILAIDTFAYDFNDLQLNSVAIKDRMISESKSLGYSITPKITKVACINSMSSTNACEAFNRVIKRYGANFASQILFM
ncbi:hypothetical protein ROZALSC1DRAFT_22315 [Rozella allomycis CSF55]|uniref:Uncharacterized protein n=1 Tax=Rozella allomycis (strain CSF55) TaxID=988480 RepID=A0A4P9YJ34_ROZAC|nr:hypothetical protein ROZALSC1DRAFT_22315 [Rozella allomycis CSF55]